MLNLNNKGEKIATFKRNGNPVFISLEETYLDPTNSYLTYEEKQPCFYCGRLFSDKWNLQRHHSICRRKLISSYSQSDPLEIKLLHLDSNIKQYPRKDIQEILYVTGIRGSGKSTYVADYIKLFKKTHKRHRVVLISNVDKDLAYSGIGGILKLKIDESMCDNDELGLDSFRTDNGGSLVIFDDIDFTSRKITKYIERLLSVLIKHGRDHEYEDRDIYVIYTSHIVSNYNKTREIINECSSFTFFPGSGSPHHVEQFLKVHCGLNKFKINKLLSESNGSRWVTIYKHNPMYCLHERGVIMLKNL